jgi:hypothetical protein
LKETDPPNNDRSKQLLLSNDTNEPPERGSDGTPTKKVRYQVLAEDAKVKPTTNSQRRSPTLNAKYCIATYLASGLIADDMFTFMSLLYLHNTFWLNTTNISPLILQQEEFEPPTRIAISITQHLL